MKVYINYPVPHFTIHRDLGCALIQMHEREGQRVICVNEANRSEVLSRLTGRDFRFAARRGLNDLWLDITLGTPGEEEQFVRDVQAVVGRRYRPLARALIKIHC